MNVPGMAKWLYTGTEQFLSDSLKQLLTDRIASAEEEEQLAMGGVITIRAFQQSK